LEPLGAAWSRLFLQKFFLEIVERQSVGFRSSAFMHKAQFPPSRRPLQSVDGSGVTIGLRANERRSGVNAALRSVATRDSEQMRPNKTEWRIICCDAASDGLAWLQIRTSCNDVTKEMYHDQIFVFRH
jgi:hypothetical protein